MEWQERDGVLKIGEEQDIVIVGGGICGLATALALHRFSSSIVPAAAHSPFPLFVFVFFFLVVFSPLFLAVKEKLSAIFMVHFRLK